MATVKNYLKRGIALILIFVLCLNNFAAVVSDNDGSAFITKAEFDSLKNNFQSQINQFNTSIDAKIDNAIGAYLAGIKLEKKVKKNTIHSDWNNIEFINYEILPDFKVPDYTWTVTAGWHTNKNNSEGTVGDTYDRKLGVVGGYKKYKRVWADNEYNLRPLTKIILGNENDFATTSFNGILAWGGVASRFVETWMFNKYGYGECYNMTGNTEYRVYMQHPFTFGLSGYVKDVGINNLLPIKPRFQDNNASAGSTTWYISPRNTSNNREDLDYNYYEGYYDFNIVLDAPVDENTICHDHVFVDNGDNVSFWLSNERFNNTLNYCNYQTITDRNIGTVAGATTVINGERVTFNTSGTDSATGERIATSYTGAFIGNIEWDYDDSRVPMLGLLPKHYNAKDIFQEEYDLNSSRTGLAERNVTWDNITISNAAPLTLQNGLEVCVSAKDKTYEWELDFDTITLMGSTGTRTNQNEVDVYLSKVPFGNGVTSSSKVQLIVGNEKKDFVTTVDRYVKLKWEVDDEKTMIYMKCIPHWKSTDMGNESFLIKLSDNCNQVDVTTVY